MSNNPQDGVQGPSTLHQRPRIYKSRMGAANQEGTYFEIKMCALVFLRAVQSYSNFTMTSNDSRAGGFDDIVVSYGTPGNEQSILVQLKTGRNRINLSPPAKRSLKYYFQSLETSHTSEHFENRSLTYVFFSNADVKLNPCAANVESPVRNLLCTSWKPGDVFQVDLNYDNCKDFMNDTGADDFVKRLLIFRNQCGPEYLDELIKQELIKICNGFASQFQTIQQTFVGEIQAWWGKDTKVALSEDWEVWAKLKQELFSQNTLLKQIKFCEDTLSNLEKRLLDTKSDIILLNFESTEAHIACSKVCQTFIRKVNLPVLFTDISEPQSSQSLFSLWSKDAFEVLVITDVTNCCQNLAENIAKYKGKPEKQNKKKIVIVSSSDASTLGLSQDSVDVVPTEHIKSTFSQLDDNSKNLLQMQPVNFQGKEIALGEIMDDRILEGGFLQCVLTSPTIQIGTAPPACEGIYIRRHLSKEILVNKRIFYSDDNFVICGIKEKALRKLITQGENLDERWFLENRRRFTVTTRRGLIRYPHSSTTHCLQVINNVFYWAYSYGDVENLIKYIQVYPNEEDDCKNLIRHVSQCWVNEDDLVRKEFQFQRVIVAGEPGCGKTVLLRKVASMMKEVDTTRWVIYIDLNKYTNILKEIKQPDNVTLENVLDFLSKVANPDDSELGKQLLKYSVSESRNTCILFDAFDEIAPAYTETVLAILQLIIRDFTLLTLLVASRYDVKERLENILGSKRFRVKALTYKEQIGYMSELWGMEKTHLFQQAVRSELPYGVLPRVLRFPLHLNMICEMYGDLVMSDNFSSISVSFKINNLYEEFIEKKFSIYFNEKARYNNDSAQTDIIKENVRQNFMKDHMICSLVALGLLDYINEPLQSDVKNGAQEICQDIKEGKEKLGFIDGVVDGKPHFIHRTFAEFFAGKWFARHWKECKWFVRRGDFAKKFEIVYKGFCQELASKLPAHLAVLNGDIKALERLKDDLNKTDDLGRTPLHLAAQFRDRQGSTMVSELLKYRPNLEITETLSGCTPLYYAAKAESWDVVRILLQAGARVIGEEPYLEIEAREEFVQAMEISGRIND